MKNINRNHRSLFAIILSFLIPISLLIIWHIKNKGYPWLDEATYFSTTQVHYLTFKHQGWINGFKELYFYRSWKPILHPVLGLPFIIIFQGNIKLCIASYTLTLFILCLTFIFRIARQYLSYTLAALVTIAMATFPDVFISSTTFTSELPSLLFSLATLYYFLKIENFTSSKECALLGIFLGLLLCTRPIIGSLIFIMPLMLYIFICLKTHKLILRDIFAIFPALYFSFKPITIFLEYARSPLQIETVFILSSYALGILIPVIFYKKLKLNRPFLLFFLFSSCLPLLWFIPHMLKLYTWIHITGFSDVGIMSGFREQISRVDIIASILKSLCSIQFLYLLIIACSYFYFKRKIHFQKAIPILLMTLIPNIALIFSNYSTLRFIIIPGIFMFLFLFIVSVRPLPQFKKRFLLIVPVLFFQVSFLMNSIFGITIPLSSLIKYPSEYTILAVPRQQKTYSYGLFQHLQNIIHRGPFKMATLHLQPLNSTNSLPLDLLTNDAWQIQVLSNEKNLNWISEYPFYYCTQTNLTESQRIELLLKNYHYIILGPLEGKVDDIWLREISLCAKRLEQNWKNKNLDASLIEWTKKIDFVSNNEGQTSALIIKTTYHN